MKTFWRFRLNAISENFLCALQISHMRVWRHRATSQQHAQLNGLVRRNLNYRTDTADPDKQGAICRGGWNPPLASGISTQLLCRLWHPSFVPHFPLYVAIVPCRQGTSTRASKFVSTQRQQHQVTNNKLIWTGSNCAIISRDSWRLQMVAADDPDEYLTAAKTLIFQ